MVYKLWTTEEELLIRKYYGKIKVSKIQRVYLKKRTEISIICHAKMIGLKSNKSIIISGKNAPFWNHHHTKKNRNILSLKQKKRFKDKRNHPFYKRPHSLKTRIKLSLINKQRWKKIRRNKKEYLSFCKKRSDYMKGKNNPFYIDGNGYMPYPKDWSLGFRKTIRDRDKKCAICGVSKLKCVLDVHHINRKKFDLSPKNLISLCHYCHGRIFCIQNELQDHFHAKLMGLV